VDCDIVLSKVIVPIAVSSLNAGASSSTSTIICHKFYAHIIFYKRHGSVLFISI
jgi:hypothetical protein